MNHQLPGTGQMPYGGGGGLSSGAPGEALSLQLAQGVLEEGPLALSGQTGTSTPTVTGSHSVE